MSKKEYYAQYHKRTYIPKERYCQTCSKSLIGLPSGSKRCPECLVMCNCVDCKKDFIAKNQRFLRCSSCQYNHYKNNLPEKFEKTMNKVYRGKAIEKRDARGLPQDHVFFNGPKKEGYLNKKGYRLMCIQDPKKKVYKRIYEHHLVMGNHIGRDLYSHERIHHKNGVRDDNRIENLELWSIAQPPGQRIDDKIKYYIEFLQGYGYKVIKE